MSKFRNKSRDKTVKKEPYLKMMDKAVHCQMEELSPYKWLLSLVQIRMAESELNRQLSVFFVLRYVHGKFSWSRRENVEIYKTANHPSSSVLV